MKKRILKFQIVILILLLQVFNCSYLNSSNIKFLKLSNLIGEKLKYRFSFFIFRKAAIVKLSFRKLKNNYYIAKLEGQTKGIIGMFTAFRKDIYISYMKFDNKTNRLIPLKFIKKTQIGENIRESIYKFNYKDMEIEKTKKKIEDGKLKYSRSYIIKFKGNIDDYLTCAYNFRLGIYGFPEKNKPIKIKVLPEKNKKDRFIKVFYVKKKKDIYELKAKIVKDIVKTKNEEITGYITINMLPVKGVLPGVPIFGDIKAYLESH